MMFGPQVRFGITYKVSQPGFVVYRRKYYHNYKIAVSSENFEGACGMNLGSVGSYVMAKDGAIAIYD